MCYMYTTKYIKCKYVHKINYVWINVWLNIQKKAKLKYYKIDEYF